MTQAELIATLPEGRLPPGLMQLNATDFATLFGAGLLMAALLCWLTQPLLQRRPSRRVLIRATRGMPPQERALAIARILGRLPEELRATAYGAAPALRSETIERIALKARRRHR
ncbi:hypothetical protein KHC28_06350 [Ancylobacter sonchi]|uniref:hypothetical protein n=1 Tax=Ancylobacter sonchi TaxID=1937790 RepID=UPI001BD5AEC1|nr:hypothetical protein [Ancylobacter sonchi]MBS7533277.1 hypothetical protein [Ancylobacter sonchi]